MTWGDIWATLGVSLGLFWVNEGGFGSLLGYLEMTLDVVAGFMVSSPAPNGLINSKHTFLRRYLLVKEVKRRNRKRTRIATWVTL